MPQHTFDEQFKRNRELLRAKATQATKPPVSPAPGAPPRAPVAPPRPTFTTTSLGAAGAPGAGPDLTTSRGATSFERPQAPTAPEKAGLRSRFDTAKQTIKDVFSRGAGAPPPPAGSVPATPAAPAPGDRPSLRQRAQKGVAPKLLATAGVAKTIRDATDPDSTARFARRFGVSEPTGDRSLGDILKFAALRAGGAASDFGANVAGTASQLVGGPEDIVSRFFRDNEGVASVPATQEPVSAQTALDATGRTPPVGARPEDTAPPVQTLDQELRRNQVRQIGPNSFTNVPAEQATQDLGKPGGGLSVIGRGLSPEDTLADLRRQVVDAEEKTALRRAGLEDTGEGREALARLNKRRERDSEIFALTQAGLSPDEAARRIFARDAKLAEAEIGARGTGGADLSDQIALLSLQQRTAAEDARAGLRQEQLGVSKEQLALNQEQLRGQQSSQEAREIQSTINQLNDPDPGTREAALDNVFESATKNPNSAAGQLAFSEITKIVRENAFKERGILDEGQALLPEFLGGGPQPNFNAIAEGNFTLETGFAGTGLTGTKIIDENGVDLGNLQDYPASAQKFIKDIFRAKQQNQKQQGLRR